MKIPFIGGSYRGRSKNINAQRTINLFLERGSHGSIAERSLYGTPGLNLWLDIGSSVEIRGEYSWNGKGYVVAGDILYECTSSPAKTSRGTLDSSTGPVYFCSNETQLLIVDGADGYTYTPATTTFAKLSSPFPGAGSCCILDGYGIVNKPGTDEDYISAFGDLTSWSAADYASAEQKGDTLVRVLSDQGLLWNFGTETIEVWHNVGSLYPFSPYPGGLIEKGCIAPASVCPMDNSIYFLSNDGMVLKTEGINVRAVSTRQIEAQFATYTDLTDAIAYSFVKQGHSFYRLTFPTDDHTWEYDSAEDDWHEVSSGLLGGRHKSNCYMRFDNKDLVGDYSNGKIYEMDMDVYQDDGAAILRTRTAQALTSDRKNLLFHSLEILFEPGVGINPGYSEYNAGTTYDADDKVVYSSEFDVYKSLQGSNTGNTPDSSPTYWEEQLQEGNNPQAILDWSDDGCNTWSNEHWTSIGKLGEYAKRAIWRRLGMARQRVFRVQISDPVKVVIIDAFLNATKGTR